METTEVVRGPKLKELKGNLYRIVLTPVELALIGHSIQLAGEFLSPDQVFERGLKDPRFLVTPLGLLTEEDLQKRQQMIGEIRRKREGACVRGTFSLFRYKKTGAVPWGWKEEMVLQDLQGDGTVNPAITFRLPASRRGEEHNLILDQGYKPYMQLQESRRPGELKVVLKSAVLV